MVAFQFYFQQEKHRNVGWVEGATVMLYLVKNSLVKSKCETVHCCDATESSFVAKVQIFAHFHAVWPARTSSLWKIPRCHIKWWACPWLCSSTVSPFSVSVTLDFPSTAHACLIIERVPVELFPRFTQNLMLFLCRIHCEIVSDQTHDYK
jgi:hypothetical protein